MASNWRLKSPWGYVPVDVGLPDSIEKSVEEVQEHGANEEAATIGPVDEAVVVGVRSLLTADLHLLPVPAETPDDHGQGEEDNEGDLGPDTAADGVDVEAVAVNNSTDDLRKPVEQVVEGAGAGVEVRRVHVVVLVGVEDVGGEEHGEEQQDPGLLEESVPEAADLAVPRRVLHEDDLGVVLADDLVSLDEAKGQAGADDHENDEGDVGAVGDCSLLLVDVLGERDEGANDGAQVEDDPEPRNVAALAVLGRVRHHDGSLGSPEQTRADTEEGAGEDDEADILGVRVAQEGRGVNAVAQATDGEGRAETETVGKGSSEEADDGKGAVEGDTGVVLSGGIDLATAAEASEGVVHAGAEEADDGDHEQLDLGRGVPEVAAEDAEVLVDPASRTVDVLNLMRLLVGHVVEGDVLGRLGLVGGHDDVFELERLGEMGVGQEGRRSGRGGPILPCWRTSNGGCLQLTRDLRQWRGKGRRC